MKKFLKNYSPLLFILLIALLIRLISLIKYGDFWADEMFSFVYSQKPWLESAKFWIWETNPPLHLFLLKLWFYLFPANEFWARLPSLIFSLLAIIVLYRFCLRLFNKSRTDLVPGKSIAWLASFILSFSAINVFFSTTARTYSLLILLTILSVDYFFRIFLENQRTSKNIVFYIIINTLFLYSHLTSWSIILVQFIITLGFTSKQAKRWILINLIPLILWLIWAIPSFIAKLQLGIFQRSWFLNLDKSFGSKMFNLSWLTIGPMPTWYISFIFLLIFAGGWFLIFYRQLKHQGIDKTMFYLFLFLLFPIIIAEVLNLNFTKFFLVSLPWLIISMAYLMNFFTNKKCLPLFGLSLFIVGLFYYLTILPINNWGELDQFINPYLKKDKKQILIYDNFANKSEIEYYLRSKIPAQPFLPEAVSLMDWDYFFITHNYLSHHYANEEINHWLTKIDIGSYDELFLLQNSPNSFINFDLASQLKKFNFYQAANPKKLKVLYSPSLIYFKKAE